jgi:hypothetical protein
MRMMLRNPRRGTLSMLSLITVVLCSSWACSSEDEEATPNPDGGEIAAAPGVCHAICCADTDCASGESCVAFDSAAGTFGACSGTGAGQWGSTTSLPAGCWTLNAPQCDPYNNDQCTEEGDVCGYQPSTDPEFPPLISCAGGDHSRQLGQTCDAVGGPWCQLGLHCVPN